MAERRRRAYSAVGMLPSTREDSAFPPAWFALPIMLQRPDVLSGGLLGVGYPDRFWPTADL